MLTIAKQQARQKTAHRQQGFSLIELMVVLVLAAILAGLGMPSLRASIDRNAVSSEALRLVRLLNFARSEAVTKDQIIVVRGAVGGSDWSTGWSVYSDDNGNINEARDVANDELLQDVASDATSITIVSNSNGDDRIAFQRDGRMLNASTVRIAVCDLALSDRVDGTLITINAVGRVQTSVIPSATRVPANCRNP